MDIREAILATASDIESNPAGFNFRSTQVPDSLDCGTPGCAIGITALHLGCNHDIQGFFEAAKQMTAGHTHKMAGTCSWEFYCRMDDLISGWHSSAAVCAQGLRLYADKYFPASIAQPIRFPDWRAMASGSVPADAISEDARV